MTINIEKSKAEGVVNAPPSKSMAHRLLIAAALCNGESRINGISVCEDVLATADCLNALGAKVKIDNDVATVIGGEITASEGAILRCRESGSTLRFMIPLSLLCDKEITLTGSEGLMARPQSEYERIADEKGFKFDKKCGSITVKGKLDSGNYLLRGDVSSQFITGLMLALSLLGDDSRIHITTKVESRSYIDLTMDAMSQFGVETVWENDSTIHIRGGQEYKARNITVEGDYSGAAFLDAFNHLGGEVRVQGLKENSLQGDRVYMEYFSLLDDGFATLDVEDCPDLAPILFTLAALKKGAYFTGTKRLKIKESDRAQAMKEELSKFGAELILEENSVRVTPGSLHTPDEPLCSHNDHRIVMSMAVIASVLGGEIDGCEAVAKSYPNFFEDIKKLGIKFYETN